VPDNRFRNALRLYLGRTKLLQLGQSDEAALEIKRHVRRRHVPRCSADIVEQACQRPRFEKRARLPVGQVLRDNLVTWFAVCVSFSLNRGGRVKWRFAVVGTGRKGAVLLLEPDEIRWSAYRRRKLGDCGCTSL
jgi:hypothetical protein